jgi:site-specific DNA-methyltransferase (adenine-specific)
LERVGAAIFSARAGVEFLLRPGAARTVEVVRAALQTELGQLFAEDAIAWMATLPDGSVDLVFADPPYNAGREGWDTFAGDDEYLQWSAHWLAEAARILKPTGSLYVCGFSEQLADLKVLAARHFHGCRWLIWHYRNKGNLGRDWGRAHESVIHLRHRGFVLNLDEARVPYNAHTLRYPVHPQAETSRYGRRTYVWRPHPLGAKPRDVLEIPTLTNGMPEKSAHPTQKPLELVRRLVAAATPPGGLVVDPFGGSGTTFVACEALGRRWLGCEISPAYRRIISARLKQRVNSAAATHAEARRRRQRARLK